MRWIIHLNTHVALPTNRARGDLTQGHPHLQGRPSTFGPPDGRPGTQGQWRLSANSPPESVALNAATAMINNSINTEWRQYSMPGLPFLPPAATSPPRGGRCARASAENPSSQGSLPLTCRLQTYNPSDKPPKKPRRGPNCGAPTPTPVPLRISYSLSRRLMTSTRAVSVLRPAM